MAYLGYSDDFDLDDDGILRDSLSSAGGIVIDDDGIIRDSFDTQSKYTTGSTGTHWTDSGLERDKQIAGSSSTLRHSDLQSYQSFDDVSHPLDDHANISDLEASKDDLSLDQDFENEFDRVDKVKGFHDVSRNTPTNLYINQSGRSSRSSFNNSLNFEDTEDRKSAVSDKDLFDPEYYKQLQELGVLLDGADFSNDKNSLNEFEELEAHVSRDHEDFTDEDEQGDEIEEFLRRTPTREQLIGNVIGQRYADDGHEPDDVASRTRPSTANSARTIGSEPFPEISPEEALQLFENHVQQVNLVDNDAASIEFQESQQTPGDDDEIFIITSRISDEPGTKKRKSDRGDQAGDDRSISPRSITSSGSRPSSRISDAGSRSNTPYRRGQGQTFLGDRSFSRGEDSRSQGSRSQSPFNRSGSLTPVSSNFPIDSRPSTYQGSRSHTPTNRPDSAASQRSLASDSISTKQKSKAENTSTNLSKAKSQESFFHSENQGDTRSSSEKMPKRLLPKPSATEVNQPLKVKSKSTTNIAAKKSKPLKPTMSLVNIDIGEGENDHSEISTTSEKSRTELSSKLYQEFHKRKQATELVQQLQQDYDKLLSKYAQAELTIDQLRLGATVTLHAASPTPSQALAGALPGGQQPQTIQMGQMGRGVKSPSPFQGSLGVPSPLTLNESVAADHFPDRNAGHNDSRFSGRRTESEASLVNGYALPPQNVDRRDTSVDGAEGLKMGLTFHAQTLDQRMDSFQALLDAGQGMTHDEQERVFDKIRNDHETLRKDYLRAKEDYNARKRSTAAGDVTFDDNKELEGELFKLGMKFDEIHEKVEEKRKERHSQRQPFATNRRQSDSDVLTSGMSDQETRSVDQMKKKIKGTKAGVDMLEPKQDDELEKNLKRLHDEYNALMDRYRRLKQMAQTPERDQEIDNLVRKLHQICEEEPDVFPMPHELEGSGRNSSISSSSTFVSHDTSVWDEETDTETNSRWEELQRGEEDGRSFSRRQSEASVPGRRQSKDVGQPYATTENKHITKGRDTPENAGSNSSSLHRSDLEINGAGRLNDSSMYGSRSSLSSRHDSTFDRDSPTPRLPRPRRHDHPDRRSGNLKKRPEGASLSSLQDSGISDYEGATGRDRGTTGPLSNLPGPGTFKQMTKQRHAGDADSGFIGSMVGSDVSHGHLSARQQQQQQPTLRLRQPSDSGSERPRSRSRPDDTHSITSSRSGRRSQDSARPRTRRDQAAQSRDYTDDSYTLTTESEMSFDIPERPGSRRGRNQGQSRGSFDRAIQEEEEDMLTTLTPFDSIEEFRRTIRSGHGWSPFIHHFERPRSILSNSSRSSRRSQQQKMPTKTAKPKQNVSFSSKSDLSEDEATPRHTPNQSFNDSREVLSSGEETPREQAQPVVERLNLKEPATVTRQDEPVQPPTPGARKEIVRPPTPGVKTPRSERSATPVRRQEVQRTEVERPGSREELPRSRPEVPKVTEDRAVGSDSDDTVKDSVATAGTRGSESSEKFKLLQEEIGHLREEFFRAMQQKQHSAPPPPAPPQPRQEGDQFFDPTEDPYAFMRGPRRRANSFSGAAARDWDDWWKYPLNQQADDMPLGYAAADSYNQSRPVNAEIQEARTRSRRKMRRKYRRTADSEAQTLNESDSDQAPSRVTASTVTDEQLYNYYVPQYYSPRTQTSVPPVYYTPSVPPRIQRYSSQPNLLQNSTMTTAPPPPVQIQNVPTNSYATPISAGYNRLRSSLRQPRPRTNVRRPYSYDDIDTHNQEPIGYIVTNAPPPPAHTPPPPPVYMERTQACPLCGGAGYHTHGEYVYDASSERPTMGYLVHDTPRRRPRRRSKSASRVQDYSPQGRSRSRYVFREYLTESSSAESDDDIVYRRRSRSVGRRSRRKTRKYKKVKPGVKVVDNDLSVTPGDGASHNPANNVPVRDTTLHNISASNLANLSSNTLLTRVVTPVHMTAPVNVSPAHVVTPVQVTTSVNVTPARVLTPVHFVTPVSSVANSSMFTPVAGNLSNTTIPQPASSLDVVLPEVPEESQEYEDALNQSLNLTEEIGDLTYKMMGTVKSELAKSKRHKDFGSSYW